MLETIEKRIKEIEADNNRLSKVQIALKQEHSRTINKIIKNDGALDELRKLKESFPQGGTDAKKEE